jgi:hypothetical protein
MNKQPDIRSEEILLLGLCRMVFNAELKVMLMALTEEVTDWRYFSRLANEHGVAALVYHNLEKLDFLKFVSKEAQDFLRNALLMSLGRNSRNIIGATEALKILNRENIKTVLLKGLALELSVYGNEGLRQMTDVDVLVSREDCMKARKALMSEGFISRPVKSVFHKLIMEDTGKHLPTLSRNDFNIELHHELFGAGRNLLTKILFDNSHETDLSGSKTYIPEPQIFFLYLVKHLYLHEMNNESQLRLYTDLVVLIERYREEILNTRLLELAKQADMDQMLAWRLEPLRDLWGITFPEWMNDFINIHYNPASINKFVFFLGSPKNNPVNDKAKFYREKISEIPGLHRKVLYVLGDLFPTISFMKKRYGRGSVVRALLYYPHRLGKLWYLIR